MLCMSAIHLSHFLVPQVQYMNVALNLLKKMLSPNIIQAIIMLCPYYIIGDVILEI